APFSVFDLHFYILASHAWLVALSSTWGLVRHFGGNAVNRGLGIYSRQKLKRTRHGSRFERALFARHPRRGRRDNPDTDDNFGFVLRAIVGGIQPWTDELRILQNTSRL